MSSPRLALLVLSGEDVPATLRRGREIEVLSWPAAEGEQPSAAWNQALSQARAPRTLVVANLAELVPSRLDEELELVESDVLSARDRGAAWSLAAQGVTGDEPGFGPWLTWASADLGFPTQLARELGGFDEVRLSDGRGALLDLAYRLDREGLKRHRIAAPARSELSALLDEVRELGRSLLRLRRKHRTVVGWPLFPSLEDEDELGRALLRLVEADLPRTQRLMATLRRCPDGADASALAPLATPLADCARVELARGALLELRGREPGSVVLEGPPVGPMTSIVIVSHESKDTLTEGIARLRATVDPRHPIEILVVDNGSTDGSREWLARQGDVQLLALPENVGAPRARNLLLEKVAGEQVVFLDDDVHVEPGWLRRMLHHLAVDDAAAFVGPVSDRAAHGQQVVPGPLSSDAAAVEARRRAEEHDREHRLNAMLASFCLLTRRGTLEMLGGFDPRFSPWGFEDDDLTLRASLAGWHCRIADDVFVRHLPYDRERQDETHQALLQRNWRRFADKWGLSPTTPYGRHEEVHRHASQRSWSLAELHVSPTAPEPRSTAIDRMTAPTLLPSRVDRDGPRLSVLVPAHERPERLQALVESLRVQTCAPDRFELVVVDDGSRPPLELPDDLPFAASLHRQANAGPAAARNHGLEHCRGALTLVLNDDSLPAPGLVAAHLRVHDELGEPASVLGRFDFVHSLRTRFLVQLLQDSDLLFDYPSMTPGARQPWQCFWTCNLSLPTSALRQVGGFDAARFPEALCEDVELGYRLERLGLPLIYRDELACGHDHDLSVLAYFRRLERLGAMLVRLHDKHGDPRMLWRNDGRAIDEAWWRRLQLDTEESLPRAREFRDVLLAAGSSLASRRLTAQERDQHRALLREARLPFVQAGMLHEARGARLLGAGDELPSELTTVAVLAGEDGAGLDATLAAVIGDGDASEPAELLIGRGESPGSFLPRVVERARGTTLAVLLAGTTPPPGWLRSLRRVLWSDPGCSVAASESELAGLPSRHVESVTTAGSLWRVADLRKVGGFDGDLDDLATMLQAASVRLHASGSRLRLVAGEGLGGPSSRWSGRRRQAWETWVERRGAAEAAVGDVGVVLSSSSEPAERAAVAPI
ncbi:MAG: glycosyltransferase [Acidobacteriota bacterium]